jgi:hypothetical protein
MSKPFKQKRTARRVEERSNKLWVRLPNSIVQARVGLIPSCETDANPPPDGLTAEEIMAWHRGLSVELKTK